MKIALVVDDEPLIRRQVTNILFDYGFDELFEAEDGAQAVAVAAAHKPLLTVMDSPCRLWMVFVQPKP